jgi:hypothetical protein
LLPSFNVFDDHHSVKGERMKTVSHCSSCNQDKTIETRRAKPFSNVVTTQCGCGYDVQVVAFFDVEKCCSTHPLPGYSREEMHQKCDSTRIVLGQSSGFIGA